MRAGGRDPGPGWTGHSAGWLPRGGAALGAERVKKRKQPRIAHFKKKPCRNQIGEVERCRNAGGPRRGALTDGRRGVEEAARPRRPRQGSSGAGSGLHQPHRLGCAQSWRGCQARGLTGLQVGQAGRGLGLPWWGGAAETRSGLSPLLAQGFAAPEPRRGDLSWIGKGCLFMHVNGL